MAYRELGVIEVREVLRRSCLGEGLRAIARGTGSDGKTIPKYVAAATAVGLQRGHPAPTDEQVAAVLAAVPAAPVGRPGRRPGPARALPRPDRGVAGRAAAPDEGLPAPAGARRRCPL